MWLGASGMLAAGLIACVPAKAQPADGPLAQPSMVCLPRVGN
jgi:hypothetical protein